jgi:hypothetical protein
MRLTLSKGRGLKCKEKLTDWWQAYSNRLVSLGLRYLRVDIVVGQNRKLRIWYGMLLSEGLKA